MSNDDSTKRALIEGILAKISADEGVRDRIRQAIEPILEDRTEKDLREKKSKIANIIANSLFLKALIEKNEENNQYLDLLKEEFIYHDMVSISNQKIETNKSGIIVNLLGNRLDVVHDKKLSLRNGAIYNNLMILFNNYDESFLQSNSDNIKGFVKQAAENKNIKEENILKSIAAEMENLKALPQKREIIDKICESVFSSHQEKFNAKGEGDKVRQEIRKNIGDILEDKAFSVEFLTKKQGELSMKIQGSQFVLSKGEKNDKNFGDLKRTINDISKNFNKQEVSKKPSILSKGSALFNRIRTYITAKGRNNSSVSKSKNRSQSINKIGL